MDTMLRLAFLASVTIAMGGAASAQTSDLVFFTDDGERFTLIVDGAVKNDEPASRVVATGIRNETPMIAIRFQNAAIPEVRKGGYFPMGMEYTVMVTTNKKGERVMRPSGEAPLGTAAKPDPAKPVPSSFVDDPPAPAAPRSSPTGAQQTTTITVVEEGGAGSENVDLNMVVPGFSMNMTVNDGSGTTTTTTTTTTTSYAVTETVGTVAEPETEAAYVMPGYSGPIGCPFPMEEDEFGEVRKSIAAKSFEDSRMTLAKQVARDRCFTAGQVKDLLGLFSFEDSKLDLAKFAYDHTYDIGNYYKVNDAFGFESSIEELDEFIRTR